MTGWTPGSAANPWLRPSRPLIIAHRGHSLEVPENTTEAYRRAIELGTEMIEADVNISRDGQLVMMHDALLDRTTDGHGPVSDLSWSELADLDAGRWFGEDFAGLRIPTTEDTIELARDAGIWMCFEVKGGNPAESEQISNALVRLLVARDALGFAAMSGYNHNVLALAKRYAPELVLAPERLPDYEALDALIAIAQARALEAPIIQIHHRFLTAGLVDAFHDAGVAVWSWPTTEEAAIVSSVAAGVDGLMGDDVWRIVDVVERDRGRPVADQEASHAG
jgi:glycerophosphoryl diester phosphodiesterase